MALVPMAFPTPTIYQYRVLETRNARNANEAFFIAQFSINAGVTWFSLYPWTFQDVNEAYDVIANEIRGEAQLRKRVQKKAVTYTQIHPYPPA